MKIVIQRVKKSTVKVDNKTVGEINHGMLVFLAIAENDSVDMVAKMAEKILKLRIFSDKDNKMNLSLMDTGGEMLVVSQFTLLGDTARGNRPSFLTAGAPEKALLFYDKFVECIRDRIPVVETGVFAADMEVALVNDGPVTMIIEL